MNVPHSVVRGKPAMYTSAGTVYVWRFITSYSKRDTKRAFWNLKDFLLTLSETIRLYVSVVI